MKRLNNIYSQMCQPENLLAAAKVQIDAVRTTVLKQKHGVQKQKAIGNGK